MREPLTVAELMHELSHMNPNALVYTVNGETPVTSAFDPEEGIVILSDPDYDAYIDEMIEKETNLEKRGVACLTNRRVKKN